MRTLAAFWVTMALGPALPAEAQEPAFERGDRNVPGFEPAYAAQTRAPVKRSGFPVRAKVLADGLVYPWAVAELPGEAGLLVTERPGRLRRVTREGALSEPIEGVPAVASRPPSEWPVQGGLLDVKLGPSFAEDRFVYLTYAKAVADGKTVTAAARGRLSEDFTTLSAVEEIFVQHPPSGTPMHYGSRLVFDGHGHVYITTGEHSSHDDRDFAQQLSTTYGKVVRLALDGSIPDDNPYVGVDGADDAIWSYGHRNIQGAALMHGLLFTIEHGPAGGDELNLPLPTRNYGWPIVSYGRRYAGPRIGSGRPRMSGMEEPLYYWDPVIAPADMTVYQGEVFPEWKGDLLITALVGHGLVRLTMEGLIVTGEERLLTELGRTRDVELLRDGTLIVAIDAESGSLVHVTRGPSGVAAAP